MRRYAREIARLVEAELARRLAFLESDVATAMALQDYDRLDRLVIVDGAVASLVR